MEGARPAVGVAYAGNGPPEAVWSGVPAGVARGLVACGYEPVLFNVELPPPLARAAKSWGRLVAGGASGGQLTPAVSRLRTALAGRRVPQTDVELWILCGRAVSEAPSFAPVREVTYMDMTVTQAVATGFEGIASFPPSTAAAMKQRQQRRHAGATACVAGSQWAADSLVADYGIDVTKVRVVGFGRNIEPSVAERDWSTPRFLFVGKDWRRKNGSAAVEAFIALRGEVPEAHLDLVGGHPDIDLDGVVCHGMLSMRSPAGSQRLRGLYERATCFVMPSLYEAFGTAYVEAAAAGLPCIGTTNGGAATAVDGGGILVDPGDVSALTDAMRALSEPERAARLGRIAEKHARRFNWPAVTAAILEAGGLPTTAGEVSG